MANKRTPKSYDYDKHRIKVEDLRGGKLQGKTITNKTRKIIGGLIGIGILFIGLQFLLNFMVAPNKYESEYNTAFKGVKVEDINSNKVVAQGTRYDLKDLKVKSYASVNKIDSQEIIHSMVGGLYIPSVKLKIPFIEGTSNTNIVGGTLKKGQELGEGNYAIGANMLNNKKLLFTSLVYMEKGDKIFVTDKTNFYLYEVVSREKMSTSRTDMIEDREGVNEITLVAPYKKGDEEAYIVVKGNLKAKASYDKAGTELISRFNGLK